MRNRNWLMSNNQQRRIFGGLTTPSRPKMPLRLGLWLCAVIAIALLLSLGGCASQSTVPCQAPVMPPVPELSEPMPPISYSLSVQSSLQTWREKLTGTPATLKP